MFSKPLPTVAGVMSAFRTAVADLEAVAVAQRAEAGKQDAIAAAAHEAAAAAATEANNAIEVKNRLAAIFG